jgi:hypothetical protein
MLRHLEQVSDREAAQILGLTDAGASQRNLRALKRLRDTLDALGLCSDAYRVESVVPGPSSRTGDEGGQKLQPLLDEFGDRPPAQEAPLPWTSTRQQHRHSHGLWHWSRELVTCARCMRSLRHRCCCSPPAVPPPGSLAPSRRVPMPPREAQRSRPVQRRRRWLPAHRARAAAGLGLLQRDVPPLWRGRRGPARQAAPRSDRGAGKGPARCPSGLSARIALCDEPAAGRQPCCRRPTADDPRSRRVAGRLRSRSPW